MVQEEKGLFLNEPDFLRLLFKAKKMAIRDEIFELNLFNFSSNKYDTIH